jgi:hypothetical protein
VKNGQEAEFMVCDLSGKLLIENKLTNTFDLSDLSVNQLYFIKVNLNQEAAIIKFYK